MAFSDIFGLLLAFLIFILIGLRRRQAKIDMERADKDLPADFDEGSGVQTEWQQWVQSLEKKVAGQNALPSHKKVEEKPLKSSGVSMSAIPESSLVRKAGEREIGNFHSDLEDFKRTPEIEHRELRSNYGKEYDDRLSGKGLLQSTDSSVVAYALKESRSISVGRKLLDRCESRKDFIAIHEIISSPRSAYWSKKKKR